MWSETLFVVGGGSWLEQEHLDECARGFAEVHTRLNHLGIVENHKCALGQIVGQAAERVVGDLPLAPDEKFALVAACKWKLGYALIGKRIVVIINSNVFSIHLNKNNNGLYRSIKQNEDHDSAHHVNVGISIACASVLRRNVADARRKTIIQVAV